jgi:predicted dinucleotide-binding enzyme
VRVGIIGAGRLGGTLARQFSAAGHRVDVANSRAPSTLAGLATELGPRVHPVTVADAAAFADLVVLALPFGRHRELPAPAFSGRPVIDATNYEPDRDGHLPDLDADRVTSSELVQVHLADARVVKAFNTMRWDHLRDYGHEAGAIDRYGIPVAGDHNRTKWMVMDLVEQLGYAPVDAGGLASGGRSLRPGGPVYRADLTAGQLRARLTVDLPR